MDGRGARLPPGLKAAAPVLSSPAAAPLQVFRVLGSEGINVQMMSQGASKTNISLIVKDTESKHALRALHKEFFE